MHNDDVLDSILLAVARRKELPPEATLLIGEPESLSYDELQHNLGRLIHCAEWKTQTTPPWLAKVGAQLQEALPGMECETIPPQDSPSQARMPITSHATWRITTNRPRYKLSSVG